MLSKCAVKAAIVLSLLLLVTGCVSAYEVQGSWRGDAGSTSRYNSGKKDISKLKMALARCMYDNIHLEFARSTFRELIFDHKCVFENKEATIKGSEKVLRYRVDSSTKDKTVLSVVDINGRVAKITINWVNKDAFWIDDSSEAEVDDFRSYYKRDTE